MAEQTNPQPAGVEQAPASVEDRLTTLFSRDEARRQHKTLPENRKAEPVPQAQAEVQEPLEAADTGEPSQAQSDELTPDDIPDVESEVADAQPAADAFEIVHNGQQHKLSREEAIRLAQQGFDYTQKTQTLASKERQVQEALDTAQMVIKLQSALSDDLAQVKAYERALAPYQNVDWVQIATNDPMEYPKHRAAYDQLMQGYSAAVRGLQSKSEEIAQSQQKATAAMLQQEANKLRELIPAWRDGKRYSTEAKQVADYGMAEGYSSEEMASIRDARMVRTLWKAMQYDNLLKAKGEKVKQLRQAAPMAKPGAAETQSTRAQEQAKQLRTQLRKSGSVDDAARLFARMERSK